MYRYQHHRLSVPTMADLRYSSDDSETTSTLDRSFSRFSDEGIGLGDAVDGLDYAPPESGGDRLGESTDDELDRSQSEEVVYRR